MNEKEHKNPLPNYSEEKDIYYQEIEKSTFLVESELKDFKELIYLNSNINKKYTALLYCDKEQSYLYLFILRHFIDTKKENISYKIKAKLVFNKADIDKTNLDEKQIFIEEQNNNKNIKNEYKIWLINRDLLLLQVTGKKLIIINFDKKEYGVLFSNTNDKKVIQVLDIYDELVVLKKAQNSNSTRKKNFQIRTYVFCIASGVLYFFLLNEKIFTDLQFLLIPFPFEEEIRDCIDFKILKINNNSTENKDLIEKKYYFMFIVLLNGKLVRYITNLMNKSLKEILLKFQENVKNKFIKKSINIFDKGNNNINNFRLKIYRSLKCASFILLQIDFHIFSFRYYESDSPEEMLKRFGSTDNNNISNIIEISNTNINTSNENNLISNHMSSNKVGELPSEINNSLLLSNGKNISQISNSLNESISASKTKVNQIPRRHQSISTMSISSNLLKNVLKINNQTSNESVNSNGNSHNSIDQIETSLTLTDTKEFSKEFNLTLINKRHTKKNTIKKISSDKNIIIPELKTKDKDVVYYSLYSLLNLDLNDDKEKEFNQIEKDKNVNKNENFKSLEEIFRSIKYSFTFHSFITFIKTENSVIVCYIPDRSKENDEIEKVTKFNRKLSLNSGDNIQILDILHYDELKYSFLLTNNFIYKFRVNTDLLHLLNIFRYKDIPEDPKKEMIYYRLKNIFKYTRNPKISHSEKCKLCKKPESKIMCTKCKRAFYCSIEHMKDDYRNIHFFQCEMNICIAQLNSDRKRNDNLFDINNVIISFKSILNQIFYLIENKKDYINYTMYLRIMLNILEYIKIGEFMNEFLSPMRTTISNDCLQICDKIFIIELWFFYLNMNILYIDFIIKSEMYFLASKLVNKIKIVDLIENKDVKLPTMFAYFSLSNDLTKYKIDNNKEKIEQYCKNFFFNLLDIYTNGNREGNYLYIHEQFFRYYLYSFCSLLKINLFLKEKTKTFKEVTPINIDKIVYHIPILFEEKLNNAEATNNSNEIQLKLPLILLYYYLSFTLVKIDKIPTAINLLRYILEEIHKINNKKDVSKTNEISNKINATYFSLEAKIYLNIGILITYIGDFNLGIHYLENCYRLCFEKKLSTLLTMKVLNLLSLAYINYDKIDTAFILLKTAINLTKKFLTVKRNFNSTILVNKLYLLKLKIYLLFLYQYISYKYQKMNKFLSTKTKGKNNIINDPDDIPTSIFPISFNKMSPSLIGYICEEDKNKNLAEILKDKINKEDEIFKFELDSNLDKFVLFSNNDKFEMIIRALEFLYKLSDKEYEILNNDNGAIQKEEIKDDNYNNQKERSSIMSKDSSMSNSKSIINKEKFNFNIKIDSENFFDEIEVKMGLYDQLSDLQQKELKSIQNNIFRRSILLRDPKGKIDKFNLNYHPKYTFDFYELFTKMSETIFLNQLEKFGIGEQYEAKIFEHKNDGLIHSLRRYLNLEKIQNILYMEKVKLIEKYKNNIIILQKNERRETVTKNQIGANEYLNKLKEKLGKDKFLKNMNLEGLYEKLIKELTYRELDLIIENPNKIFNYIYINSKPFSEEQNSRINIQTNKENEKNEQSLVINNEILNMNNINKKSKKDIKEEEKIILSPRAIYNDLIDLISEKRNKRFNTKKQTVNFKNMKIKNILNTSKTEIKTVNENKNNENEKVKKTPIIRSTTLNKAKFMAIKSKKFISSFPNYKRNISSEKPYSFKSNFANQKNIKISDFKNINNKPISQNNNNLNINEKDGINNNLNNYNNNIIVSKIISNPNDENEFQDYNPETLILSQLSKKASNTKKRYKRDTYIFEENISQPKKIDKLDIINKNKIINKLNKKEDKKINEKEGLKKTIEKTFDKYKNKNMRKENDINLEKNNDNNLEIDLDNINQRKRKVTYVQRKKPTFKELREKVLHKSVKTSTSTFY